MTTFCYHHVFKCLPLVGQIKCKLHKGKGIFLSGTVLHAYIRGTVVQLIISKYLLKEMFHWCLSEVAVFFLRSQVKEIMQIMMLNCQTAGRYSLEVGGWRVSCTRANGI